MRDLGRLTIRVIFNLIYCLLAASKTVMASQVLPLPDESHAALTIERSLYGGFTSKDFLFVFPGKLNHFVRMPLKFDASDREVRFGKTTDHQRIPIRGSQYPGDWRGAFQSGEQIVLIDASMLQLLAIRAKDYKTVMSATVPADLLKPAADRAGEPTTIEIQKSRKRFHDSSRKIFGSRYVGFAEIPDTWEKGDTRDFLVASRIPGFSVLLMSCQRQDQIACVISRHCFLEGGPAINSRNIVGIGVLPKSRQILLGDSGNNQIRLYRFKSCFDVTYEKTLTLPSRLPKLSNLWVDGAEKLWITTETPDSFTDSNLFYWDSELWTGRGKPN
jgi:hypothetical protein